MKTYTARPTTIEELAARNCGQSLWDHHDGLPACLLSGRYSVHSHEHRLDLVSEFVDYEVVAIKSDSIIRAGHASYDYIMAGKCAGWSSATLSNIQPIEHVVELAIPEPPATPAPDDGWLHYGIGPVKELPLHYTHEHIRYWNPPTKSWEVGAGSANWLQYAIKSGTQLAILCGLEKLKLEVGKCYVLADGRVTTSVLNARAYPQYPYMCGVGGDAHYINETNEVLIFGTLVKISHPLQ